MASQVSMALAAACSVVLAACLNPAASPTTTVVEAPPQSTPRLVLWDGSQIKPRSAGTGRSGHLVFDDGGRAWADCESKPECKSTLAAVNGAGLTAGKGLKFHGEGSGWIGSGWSWVDWYPANAGTSVTAYRSLTFQIRVETKSQNDAAEPANVSVALGCSSGRKASKAVVIQPYDRSFDDGKWHKLRIPLTAFAKANDGTAFDLETLWDFRLSTWSATSREFDIYVDQIAVEN